VARWRPSLDRDQRRAAALSLLVHGLALLALIAWIDLDRPTPPPPERFLVLDLGEPERGEASAAAADDATAQPAPDPGVAADLPGRPTPGAPDPATSTAGETVRSEPETAAPEAATERAVTPEDVPAPDPRPPRTVAPAPTPRVAVAVPEIEAPEIAARPLPDALPLPPVSVEPSGGAIALPSSVPDVRAGARSLAAPAAATTGPDARAVAVPEAQASAPASVAVATPTPSVAASGAQPLQRPEARVAAPSQSREVAVGPVATVRAVRRLPVPSVQAVARAVPPDEAPGGAAAVPDENAPAGGDAASPGQEGGDEDAPAAAVGRATDDASDGDGGARAVVPTPLRETRPRPIAVILDNALGYPQSGLPQASWIAEMPVEGGVTRLMAFYDAGEPARVGPVRSARDYLVEVAGRADAVLVHVGGSPGAMIALSQGVAPSLDAFTSGELFERAADRDAPYDLYSAGGSLRDAIRTLRIDANRLLTGFRPVDPSGTAQPSGGVDIDWGGAYDSGFRYVPAQDRYRWIHNGEDAVSADGTAVQVEAVLIAQVEARRIPGDSAGRLYVPVAGGDAWLFWRGTVQRGSWSVEGGLRFRDEQGRQVALEALTTWAAFVPTSADVALR
jgi:hypothetical protein